MKLKDKKMTDKLTALRVEFGLTQAELARAVGVSRQTVSRWERGTVVPSAGNLAALGRLYSVPLDELMNEEPDGEEEPAVPEALKVPEPEAAEIKEPDAAPAPRRFSPLRLVGCAVLAGCILFSAIASAILVGFIVLREPKETKIIQMEDMEGEEIEDLLEIENLPDAMKTIKD